jgi:hypothetical protein
MKKVRATVFLVLALVFSFSAFGEVVGILGSEAFGFAQVSRAAPLLKVPATGSEEVFSFGVLSRVGGVLFQATAIPAGNAVNQEVSLRYDPARDDGQRLLVTIGTTAITPLLYDWQLIPVARYADSEYTACITLLGPAATLADQMADTNRAMYPKVHPAFSNTLIGFNLFLVDAMLVNTDLNRMRRITGSFSETIPGYHDISFDETKSASSARSIGRILRRSAYLDEWHSYIYTDCGTDISYDLVDGQLVFTGVPAYRFFLFNNESRTVTLNPALNAILRNQADVTALNPAIYTTAEKTAQWAAFFRMIRKQNPENWNGFLEQTAGIEAAPAITIPSVWLMGDGE